MSRKINQKKCILPFKLFFVEFAFLGFLQLLCVLLEGTIYCLCTWSVWIEGLLLKFFCCKVLKFIGVLQKGNDFL